MNLSEYSKILIAGSLDFCLSNDSWRVFQYRGTPKSGIFWNLFKSKENLRKERFLKNEFFIYTFMAKLQLTPNIYKEDKDEIVNYLMNWLLARVENFIHAFGFKNTVEFEFYYDKAISDYIEAPVNIKGYPKVLGERFNEQFVDKKKSLIMMLHAIHVLDFGWLLIFLNNKYGEVEFINDFQS